MEPRAGNGAGRQAERGETNPARLECQRRRWNGDGAIEIAQLSPSTMYLHTYGCARTSMCVQAGGREGLRRCLSMLLFCGFGLELGWAGLSWAGLQVTRLVRSVRLRQRSVWIVGSLWLVNVKGGGGGAGQKPEIALETRYIHRYLHTLRCARIETGEGCVHM